MKRKQLFITLFLACCVAMQAKEYHVSIKGNDANEGTEKALFRTIGKAAEYAFPGDIITVDAGTYREWVNPPRGGECDDKRIVYRAAPGEKVEIKGSERITNWTKEKNGVWKVTIPNTFFGDYNPYIDLIYGDWFESMGREHHTGEVFLNNKSLYEKETLDKVLTPVGTRTVYPLFPSSFDRGCRLISIIPGGDDRSYPPSAIMPLGCYFINATERQEYVDDEAITPEDNLEEFGPVSDEDLQYYKKTVEQAAATGKAVVASFGGTALGDIAFVPGMGLKNPKGIRNVAEWYMSTAMRRDYVQTVFEKQTDIAIANYQRLWDTVGEKVDVVFTCGTDFGTLDSQFCSLDTFRKLWLPHYKRMNDWIHEHTTWKVFKHTCGAILPVLPGLVEAGLDIINPVQINAKDMDSVVLKKEYGSQVTFWGGGIDTQRILPNATPEEVRSHVLQKCEILGKDGGFIFNAVHNIQANAPVGECGGND